jgi:hypothetical protein
MADKVNMFETEDYMKIYDSLKSDNDKVKRMLASKEYYKLHPDLKPEKRPKKVK